MTDSQKTAEQIANECLEDVTFIDDGYDETFREMAKDEIKKAITAERDRAEQLIQNCKVLNGAVFNRDVEITELRERLRTAEEAWKVERARVVKLEKGLREVQGTMLSEGGIPVPMPKHVCSILSKGIDALLQPSAPIPPPIPPGLPPPPQSVQAEDGGK